jgi:hypothetical protein
MKRIINQIGILSIVFALAFWPQIILASDTSQAQYSGIITITSNNTTALTNQTAKFILNSDALTASSYAYTNFTNTAIQSSGGVDLPYMPSPSGGTNWFVFLPSIAKNTPVSDAIYMGGTQSMNSKIAWFPASTGASTADNATMEPGNNFTIEYSAFIDTTSGASKYGVEKSGAFTVDHGSTTAGNVTALIGGGSGVTNQTTGAQDNQISSGAFTRTGERFTAFTASVTVTSIDFKLKKGGSPTGTLSVTVRKPDDTLLGTLGTLNVATLTTSYVYYTFNSTPVWVGSNTDIRIQAEYSGGDPATNYVLILANGVDVVADATKTTYNGAYTDGGGDIAWQNLTYSSPVVSATVANGEHVVKPYADGTNFKLDIDGVNKASVALNGASVPDNANAFKIMENGASPYMYSFNVTVNGTLQQALRWTNNGTTLIDSSGQGHNATYTLLASPSDPLITANMTSFAPITLAASTAIPGVTVNNYTSDNSTGFFPANMYTSGNSSRIIFGDTISSFLSVSSTPWPMFWFTFPILVIIFAGTWVGENTGSTLLLMVFYAFFFFFMAAMGIYPGFLAWLYLICATAVLLASKSYSY